MHRLITGGPLCWLNGAAATSRQRPNTCSVPGAPLLCRTLTLLVPRKFASDELIPAVDSRCRATGVVVCDNTTGDPVDMGLGPAVSELTLAIVAVNAETSDMLHSYVARPQGGEIYELFTENCPYTMDKFTSQVRGYPFSTFRVIVWLLALRKVVLLQLLVYDGCS